MKLNSAISGMSAIALLAFAATASAQTPATPASAQAPQDTAVLAVVNRMFEGFAKKDTTIIRSTLHDDVKLVTAVTNREGKPVVQTGTMDDFLKTIASAPGKLDERLFNPEIRVDGNLATVWVLYEFWHDDKYSHCGIDSFQLARTEMGWKIFSIADTRRGKCNTPGSPK
jgi:hypothetical protein